MLFSRLFAISSLALLAHSQDPATTSLSPAEVHTFLELKSIRGQQANEASRPLKPLILSTPTSPP